MGHPALFQERAVKIPPAAHHHALLLAADGALLRRDERGAPATGADADDDAMFVAEGDGFRHVRTGGALTAEADADGVRLAWDGQWLGADGRPVPRSEAATFRVEHGPEKLPSDYLAFFRRNGWVCLTSVLAPELVDELQRVARTDDYASRPPVRDVPMLCQSAALARTAAEPVSLWLVRQYIQMRDVRLAHAPALIVLREDDGERNVQGWHSDYPYHWGIRHPAQVPTPSGQTVLGVQRNVCVSAFAKARGATAFKLGSHAKDHGPPEAWGTATAHAAPGYRAAHGLPYNGPEADVVEAPAGSIILYDSRTWHRAGVNRTPHKRAAMLQAMTPSYIMPKNDTSEPYKQFLASGLAGQLNEREREEFDRLMVHRFPGPGGEHMIVPERTDAG